MARKDRDIEKGYSIKQTVEKLRRHTMITNRLDTLKVIRPTGQTQAIGSIRFDAAVALLSAWLIGGLYLDGWAHHNVAELES